MIYKKKEKKKVAVFNFHVAVCLVFGMIMSPSYFEYMKILLYAKDFFCDLAVFLGKKIRSV